MDAKMLCFGLNAGDRFDGYQNRDCSSSSIAPDLLNGFSWLALTMFEGPNQR